MENNPVKIESVDPSVSSIREEALELTATDEKDIFIDRKNGEKYIKIFDVLSEQQKAIALLLKGVINTSDVVKVGSRYFSHMQKSELIKRESDNLNAEILADRAILSWFFRDIDHSIHVDDAKPKRAKHDDNWVEYKNILVNKEKTKVNYFDFGYARFYEHASLPITGSRQDISYWRPYFIKFLEGMKKAENFEEAFLIFSQKINLLANSVFSEEKYDLFKKILLRSGFDITDDKAKRIFTIMLLRMKVAQEVISEEFKNKS